MNEAKILGLLGLARRGNRLITGSDRVVEEIRKRRGLVILAADCSANTKKLMQDKASYYGVPLYELFTMESLGNAVGYEKVSAVALSDQGLAQGVIEIIRGEMI